MNSFCFYAKPPTPSFLFLHNLVIVMFSFYFQRHETQIWWCAWLSCSLPSHLFNSRVRTKLLTGSEVKCGRTPTLRANAEPTSLYTTDCCLKKRTCFPIWYGWYRWFWEALAPVSFVSKASSNADLSTPMAGANSCTHSWVWQPPSLFFGADCLKD